MVERAARDRGYFDPQISPHHVRADFRAADPLIYESQKCVALLLFLPQFEAELLGAVLRLFGNRLYIEMNHQDSLPLLLLIVRANMFYLLGGNNVIHQYRPNLACGYS